MHHSPKHKSKKLKGTGEIIIYNNFLMQAKERVMKNEKWKENGNTRFAIVRSLSRSWTSSFVKGTLKPLFSKASTIFIIFKEKIKTQGT